MKFLFSCLTLHMYQVNMLAAVNYSIKINEHALLPGREPSIVLLLND